MYLFLNKKMMKVIFIVEFYESLVLNFVFIISLLFFFVNWKIFEVECFVYNFFFD